MEGLVKLCEQAVRYFQRGAVQEKIRQCVAIGDYTLAGDIAEAFGEVEVIDAQIELLTDAGKIRDAQKLIRDAGLEWCAEYQSLLKQKVVPIEQLRVTQKLYALSGRARPGYLPAAVGDRGVIQL